LSAALPRRITSRRVVFAATTLELSRRIFLCVQFDLASRCRRKIDTALVGQAHEIQQHVGHFERDRFLRLAASSKLCVSVSHWKCSSSSPTLARQRHGQVLGRMKLVPVAFTREVRQPAGQRVEIALVRVRRHDSPSGEHAT
jgi:hypothetical protein